MLVWEGRREPQAPVPSPLVVRQEVGAPGGANLLFHCDNLNATAHVRALHAAGELPPVSLIYIDPPYAMDKHHRLGEGSRGEVAYSDVWAEPGHYLQFMLERLAAVRGVLADDGVLCVHCDWRANSWLRLLLDEVFGRECFRNEIVWRRAPNLGHQAAAKQLGRTIDTILVYTREAGCAFRGVAPVRTAAVELTRTGRPRGAKWDAERRTWFTTAPRGDYSDVSIAALRAQGRVHETASGKVYIKYFLRQGEDGLWYKDQPVDTLWTDEAVRPLRHCSREELDIGYPTQKPEGLLRRIIEWATRPGDLVADFFCGSGTTLVAAEKLGRRWLGCDCGELAIAATLQRLKAAGARGQVLAAGKSGLTSGSPGARALRERPSAARRHISRPGTG
jgi:DNA modification methylase